MLPTKNRLRKKIDIEKVFKNGKSYREKFLILKIIKNNLTESRFGFSISQKISKKAVVRNKIKRLLNAVLQEIIKKEKINKTIDCLLIVIPGWEIKKIEEIKGVIKKIFLKAKIL